MKNRKVSVFLSTTLLFGIVSFCGCAFGKSGINVERMLELENCTVHSEEFENPLSDSFADTFRELLKNGSLTPVEVGNTVGGKGEYLEFFDDNESYRLSIRTAEGGEKYLYADSGNNTGFFTMKEESLEDFSSELNWFAPKAFYGVIDTHISDNLYIVRPDDDTMESRSSDKIFVTSEIPFNEGDRVRVGYYGGIMETYPAQIYQLFIKGGSTVSDADEKISHKDDYAEAEKIALDYIENTLGRKGEIVKTEFEQYPDGEMGGVYQYFFDFISESGEENTYYYGAYVDITETELTDSIFYLLK